MAFRGIPDKKHWFKYPKISPATLCFYKCQRICQKWCWDTKIAIVLPRKKWKKEKERKKEQEQKKNADKKLFLCPARASRPRAQRERRGSGWGKIVLPVTKCLRQLCRRAFMGQKSFVQTCFRSISISWKMNLIKRGQKVTSGVQSDMVERISQKNMYLKLLKKHYHFWAWFRLTKIAFDCN